MVNEAHNLSTGWHGRVIGAAVGVEEITNLHKNPRELMARSLRSLYGLWLAPFDRSMARTFVPIRHKATRAICFICIGATLLFRTARYISLSLHGLVRWDVAEKKSYIGN